MRKAFPVVPLVGLALLALAFAACGSDSSAGTPGGAFGFPAGAAGTQVGGGQAIGISVGGEGRASGTPDVAILRLGVSAKATTVSQAMSLAQNAMKGVIDSLKANSVPEKDIQTVQFSVYPEYGQTTLTGYRVSNVVRAKVRKVDQGGKVIDDAAAAAGDLFQVQGITLTSDDPRPLRQQAREKAIADAEAKAKELARLSGVNLGRPISITETVGFASPELFFDKRLAATGGSTAISPGELEVVVTVQVVYAIQ